MESTAQDPHAGQPVLRSGPAIAGRAPGRDPHPRPRRVGGGHLSLSRGVHARPTSPISRRRPRGTPGIPYSFLSPIAQNEPGITSGLGVIAGLIARGSAAQGVPHERVVLLGFSQGACLSLEFAARHARRYAAVVGLSGGLIGPPGTPRDYPGSFDGTPVFLGCSDVDAHIPLARVHESADVFRRMGAAVDERIYPRMGHTVNQDELQAVNALLSAGAGR